MNRILDAFDSPKVDDLISRAGAVLFAWTVIGGMFLMLPAFAIFGDGVGLVVLCVVVGPMTIACAIFCLWFCCVLVRDAIRGDP